MCGIYCSADREMFRHLYDLNIHRGNPNNISCTSIHENSIVESSEFDSTALFNVGHTQVPTNQLSSDIATQPVVLDDSILLHNGILKQKFIKTYEEKYQSTFDTYIMLKLILDKGLIEALNILDGSFSCVLMLENRIYIFRNNSGVLFVDDNLNISTTEFENSYMIPENTVYELNINERKLKEYGKFKSKSSPYFIF